MCCSLKSLPSDLQKCPKLHTLVLAGCRKLTSIELGFNKMKNLGFVSLGDHENINALPLSLDGCAKL